MWHQGDLYRDYAELEQCCAQVTIIGNAANALAQTDKEIRDVVLNCLKNNGSVTSLFAFGLICCCGRVEIKQIDRQEEYVDVDGEPDERKAISIRSGGNEVLCVDALIYAGPGVANTKHLNLEAAGVKLGTGRSKGYICTKDSYRTDNNNISAAGGPQT